jgi:hypothetical protein
MYLKKKPRRISSEHDGRSSRTVQAAGDGVAAAPTTEVVAPTAPNEGGEAAGWCLVQTTRARRWASRVTAAVKANTGRANLHGKNRHMKKIPTTTLKKTK